MKRDYQRALEALVHGYQDAVVRYCVAQLSHEAQGQDIAQDVFVAAYESMMRLQDDFASRVDVRPWLFGIARNKCKQYWRNTQRRSAILGDRRKAIADSVHNTGDREGAERLASEREREDRQRTERLLIGTGYIESLALFQDNQPEHALQRLYGMIDALETVSAPAELITYLQDIQVLIRHQVHANPRLARFLAHFEVLYQEAYHAPSERQGAGAAALTLFRTGAWLENMDLAAQVGDRAALQQGPASTYFRGALQSLGVQPALLNALAQIEHLITQPELSDRQVETVHELVQNLQHQLSN